MSVFIVGGDKLGNIGDKLKKYGFDRVFHEKGRKMIRNKNLNIPVKTGLVIVLTDFVNHNISEMIKKQAKNKEIPIIHTKRSWSAISQKMYQIHETGSLVK
ncbi:DUF2325 domain-containing protein [Peptococcaceae bacterium 1198_IL3148]